MICSQLSSLCQVLSSPTRCPHPHARNHVTKSKGKLISYVQQFLRHHKQNNIFRTHTRCIQSQAADILITLPLLSFGLKNVLFIQLLLLDKKRKITKIKYGLQYLEFLRWCRYQVMTQILNHMKHQRRLQLRLSGEDANFGTDAFSSIQSLMKSAIFLLGLLAQESIKFSVHY